jgi:TRAP-type C4-dicarboxylate transport system substrate-binding protein
MRLRRSYLFAILLLIAALALVVSGCGGEAEETTTTTAADGEETTTTAAPPAETITWVWNISSTGTATSPYGLTAAYFAEEIEKRSEGRLVVELNYGGALGYKAAEMLETVSERLVDGGDLSLPHIVGSEPLGNFGSLPFLHQGYDEYWDWLDNLLMPKLAPEFEEKWGVVPIGTFTFGSMYLLWNEALDDVEQVRGQRFRIFGDINAEFWNSLGVNVIYLPVEELQTAMERNMIDGMPNSNPLIDQLEAWEYYQYRNDLGAIIGSSMFVVNKDAFEALPEDLQQLVMEVGRDMTEYGRELLIADDARMTEELPDKGMETYMVPKETLEQMRDIGKEAWINWATATSPLAEEIMKETFAMLGMEWSTN